MMLLSDTFSWGSTLSGVEALTPTTSTSVVPVDENGMKSVGVAVQDAIAALFLLKTAQEQDLDILVEL
ncbi:hypothetical protein VB715_10145 [Crocosphaera sp. UHCC 0190]|uniref:hypothetical protein n=1 Tax=Crocosphaera sp. UHCC 0190 TaxID=3110246 RepID=UPI002B220F68|nr:hypothetical protein [Crocosphaera sp. UHCC 0190]MEA5510122.1 hypothetical protein [Crocosphaera sp. UHCC 0190]